MSALWKECSNVNHPRLRIDTAHEQQSLHYRSGEHTPTRTREPSLRIPGTVCWLFRVHTLRPRKPVRVGLQQPGRSEERISNRFDLLKADFDSGTVSSNSMKRRLRLPIDLFWRGAGHRKT